MGRETCKDQNVQFKSKSLQKKNTETACTFPFITNKRNSKVINQNVFCFNRYIEYNNNYQLVLFSFKMDKYMYKDM